MLKTNKNLILNIVKKILVCFDEKIKSNICCNVTNSLLNKKGGFPPFCYINPFNL
jgi:hypothetical protein